MASTITELRNMTKDELAVKLVALKTDLFNHRYQAETGRIEKPHRIKQIRRDIARIETLLQEGEAKDAAKSSKA